MKSFSFSKWAKIELTLYKDKQKHPNVFGIKEHLKTDNMENLVTIPKKIMVRTPRKN